MGLDITFYKRSKLDPRYSEELCYFGKVNCILTYFDIGEDDNCKSIIISKEKFEQFKDDLKKELGSHKDTSLPTKWNDSTCVDPNNEKLRTKKVFFGGSVEYGTSYWNSIRSLYRFTIKTIKSLDWDKDNLGIHCWW
jgi:hypothetical protein